MSKKYIKQDVEQLRTQTKMMLDESFFRLWMNRWNFPELSRKQKRMILKSLWNDGTIACGKIKHLEGAESLFFTGWMTQSYDYMYEPETIRFVNTRGVSFIPLSEQVINETCAIGWANSSRNPVKRSVEYFINRMVEIELILHNNLLTTQVPFMINVSPEEKLKAQDLITKVLNYEPVIFTEGDINAIQALMTGAPFIANQLRAMYYDYQSQCYTVLGIDNTKMDGSNKQFVLTEQLDSNISEVNLFKTDIDNTIQEFLDDIEEFSGVRITMENNLEDSSSMYEGAEGVKDNNPTVKEEEVNE